MTMEVVINRAGPLPISATVQSPGDLPLSLFVSGSVWSSTPNTPIGFDVLVDGTAIGKATIYSNGPTTHRSVVPVYFSITLTEGSHTIELTAADSQTNSDYNDRYQVVLFY